MEEQTRLIASRRGYKGHVTRLFTKIDELIDGEFDDYTITSLNNSTERLTRKMEKLTHIDEQLFKLYDDASELETAVMEAEESHDDIMDKVVRARRYIELNITRQSGRVSPTPASQVQSNGDQTQSTSNVAQASDILLSTTSITSEATSHVPTAATSHVPTAATSHVPTAATSHVPTAATSHVPTAATSHVPTAATSHVPTAATSHVPTAATSHVPTAATSHVPTAATSHVPTAATSHVPTAATSHVSIVVTSEISIPATSHLSIANSHLSTATTYHLPTDEYNVEVTSTQGATMPPLE